MFGRSADEQLSFATLHTERSSGRPSRSSKRLHKHSVHKASLVTNAAWCVQTGLVPADDRPSRVWMRGAAIEYVGTETDITEWKLTEETLKRTEAGRARVAEPSSMGELAGSIIHEINQPLTAVVTNAGHVSGGSTGTNRT